MLAVQPSQPACPASRYMATFGKLRFLMAYSIPAGYLSALVEHQATIDVLLYAVSASEHLATFKFVIRLPRLSGSAR